MSHIGKVASPEGVRGPPRLTFTRRLDKIVELLVHLSGFMPHRDQYQAVKILYLADREHFNRYGRPITFERYVALYYGPVASSALDMIKGDAKTLKEAGIPHLPITISKVGKIYKLDAPQRQPDYEIFSKSDLKVFESVALEHGNREFDDLFNLTHSHEAYKNAWGDRGSKSSAPIYYEDMLDITQNKAELIQDLESIAPFMK